MLPYSANLVCFVLGLMAGLSFGKTYEIKFQSNPEEVRTLKTKELTLECDIATVTSRSTGVEDIDYILSIQIADQDGIVASIKNGTAKPFIKAKDFGDKGAEAYFNVGFPSGYLHLKVPHPDESNTGNYTCTASVFKKNDAIPRIIEDETEVTWGEISFKDLVEIVANIENEKLVNMNNEIVNNDKEIVNNSKEIVNINNDMVKKQEITQGRKTCTPDEANEWRYVNVNFGRTYAKPPRVFLSHRDTDGARSGGSVYGHNNNVIYASDITTTGFALYCYSYNLLDDLEVYWIAFPRP